ncbi:gamma-glutamyltransferase [Bradyrhizobium sp. 180]|uniref:gamma-glutamyltransferase n=1 Tax=Bradyrhizobium sp. 180 TaxID=2782650 RepID=UPI0031FA0519|nr:gamma-glutamyltransferase [Bradyrhizobium sp. 180]
MSNLSKSTLQVIAAGAPAAAEAGAQMLRLGGSAADAALAAALVTCVVDPANASLLGRCQIVLRTSQGRFAAIDGASAIPRELPDELGSGPLAFAAVPGLPQAFGKLHAEHGRLPLALVSAPAVRVAEEGFAVPEHLAAIWLRMGARTLGGVDPYLDGTRSPTYFRHPRLAELLRAFGAGGAAAITTGQIARRLAEGVRARGGFWRANDLAANAPRDGELLHGRFRDCRITTIGRQGWGHSLIEMLAILDRLPTFRSELIDIEASRLIAVIETCFADRPQRLGSLEPKPNGLAFETLIAPDFISGRAAAIVRRLAEAPSAPSIGKGPALLNEDRDTTHLSTLDADGGTVALTMSIGPHFGLCATDALFGLFPAKSFRMERDPVPGARDVTEMSPVIVTRGDRVLLSAGAAGSERIPGAIAQVIVNVVDRGLSIAEAVRRPRVNVTEDRPRVHADAGAEVITALMERWPNLQVSTRGHKNHLGIVHAVGQDESGKPVGAADDAWDGLSIAVPLQQA